MRLTHEERQVFRMLANARRPSGRQGEMGPVLLSERARKIALRLADIGEEGAGPLKWPAKEQRDLTAKECDAGLSLLESAGRAALVQKLVLRRPGSQVFAV